MGAESRVTCTEIPETTLYEEPSGVNLMIRHVRAPKYLPDLKLSDSRAALKPKGKTHQGLELASYSSTQSSPEPEGSVNQPQETPIL